MRQYPPHAARSPCPAGVGGGGCNGRRLCLLWLLLSSAGCGKSVTDWKEQMRSTDPARRVEAVHALQLRAGDKDAVLPVLTEALKDRDHYVRRDAARALGSFGPDAADAVAPLLALLRDREPGVRKAAIAALKKIDPEAARRAGVK